MKTFLALVAGVILGFVAAHQFNRTEQGQRFFSDLDTKAREFGAAVADGYHAREAELRSTDS